MIFFYKFNVNYNSDKKYGDAWSAKDLGFYDEKKVIINDWTKYANNWEEFQQKFPQIEFMNFKCELGGWGNEIEIKNNLKISTSNVVLNNWNSDSYRENFWKFRRAHGYNKDVGSSHLKEVNYSYHKSFLAEHESFVYIVLYLENKKLMINHFLWLQASDSFSRPWATLKYDSIRFLGKVDLNPLLSLTIEQSKNIEDWYKKEQKVISDNKKDPNFTAERIKHIEDAFDAQFILWLTQLRTDYIQNLVNIANQNQINNLKTEIEEIKKRLINLEKSKNCIEQIVDTFKTKPTTSSSDKFIDSIADEKAIKEIFKATTKALTTSLIKGPLNAVLGCLVDSVTNSFRRRRDIIEENQFDSRRYENEIPHVNKLLNTTQWDRNITNLINHEQHLPIDNKTNFVTSNITSL